MSIERLEVSSIERLRVLEPRKRYYSNSTSLRIDVLQKIQWSKVSIDPCDVNQRPSYKIDIENSGECHLKAKAQYFQCRRKL